MGFLELWHEPGVYSRVTAGMSFRNSSLFIEVWNLSRYEGQLRNVNTFPPSTSSAPRWVRFLVASVSHEVAVQIDRQGRQDGI